MIKLNEIKGSSTYEAIKAPISNDTPIMDHSSIQEEIMVPDDYYMQLEQEMIAYEESLLSPERRNLNKLIKELPKIV